MADRRMVGSFLQEALLPAGTSADPAPRRMDYLRMGYLRMDYLGFDRVEGRWDYMSLETRAPIGLMSAWSLDRGDPDRIAVTFLPFAVAGDGQAVTGRCSGWRRSSPAWGRTTT